MKQPAVYHLRAFQIALLQRGTRDQIIEWLVWNDPNGTYTDPDSNADDMKPITIEEARRIMGDQISR